jgi:hypothetical protein
MTPAAGNYPGGRQSATSWTDSKGNFWLYGGVGLDSAGEWGDLNDLWEFNSSTNQWAWMGGNSTFTHSSPDEIIGTSGYGQLAVYGMLQTPDFANSPGGLDSALGWTDKGGNLWLYGGNGYDTNGLSGCFNDLWAYQPSAGSLPVTATPLFSVSTGTYAAGQALTISDATPGATIYYFTTGSAAATQYTNPIAISSTETVDAVAVATGYATSAVATSTYTVPATATPTFSLIPGIYPTAQTVTLADATAGATIYYAIDGTPTAASNLYSGPITVSSSETVEAIAVANGYASSAIATANYLIWPALALNEWESMSGVSVGNISRGRDQASSWTDKSGSFWLFGGNPGTVGAGLNDLWKFNPSSNEWAWMGGNIAQHCTLNYLGIEVCSLSQPGVYGALGTPSSENIPGGRFGASTWNDNNGNLWLFGGYGLDGSGTLGILNDLWEFNPSTNEWAWIGGGSAIGNNCFQYDLGGPLESNCALPSVYGTLGTPAAGNTPGSREDAVTWTDGKGNLWLFGGWGYDVPYKAQYYFDELWEFSPATGQWAWMGGSSTGDGSTCLWNVNQWYLTCGEPGTYGTIVTPSSGNIPGGRAGATGWTDSSGNLWLFSGSGFDANGYFGDPNDLWEFNTTTSQWAWMGGQATIPPCDDYNCAPASIQGTLGVPAAGNIPAGRDHASKWTDGKGNFWLYGGGGSQVANTPIVDASSDLWEFNSSANEWAWMGPAPGAGETNPGIQYGASNWTDSTGNLWLFAGGGTVLMRYAPLAPAPVPGFAVVDVNDQAFHKVDSFTVAAGTSGTTTVNTVVAGGFDSPVTLSAVGLPSGVTASFSPSSITGFGTSQVTFSVGLAVTPGNYTLSVNGASAGVVETATVSLTVAPPPANFTLGVSSSSLTVKSGASGTVTLTVTPEYGFNSAVSFACSGLPFGATCSFSPTTVTPSGGPATTVLTISTSSQSAASTSNSRPFLPLTALSFGLFLLIRKKQRGLQYIVLVAALAGLGTTLGCGGGDGGGSNGGGSGGTPNYIDRDDIRVLSDCRADHDNFAHCNLAFLPRQNLSGSSRSCPWRGVAAVAGIGMIPD